MVFVLCVPLSMPMKYSLIVASEIVEDLAIADRGLRIADCGFIESENSAFIAAPLARDSSHTFNPQSAIRNRKIFGFSLSWAPQKYSAARPGHRWRLQTRRRLSTARAVCGKRLRLRACRWRSRRPVRA